MVDGRRYENQSLGSSGYRHFKPGDAIALRYPKDRPQDAKVDAPAHFWVCGVILGAFAILFSVIDVYLWRDIMLRARKFLRRKKGQLD